MNFLEVYGIDCRESPGQAMDFTPPDYLGVEDGTNSLFINDINFGVIN